MNTKNFGPIAVRRGDSDYRTIRQIIRDEEYKLGSAFLTEKLFKKMERILTLGGRPVIVDAGANIGVASIWFSKLFPEAAIVGIEPDAENAAMFRTNCSGHPNISLLEAAVGASAGFAEVIKEGASWAVTTRRADEGARIVTIDDAVASVPNGVLFIAKIDIEGFESDLFATNLAWLDTVSAVYLEPHDWLYSGKGTSRTFQRALGERDFELFIRGENLLYVRMND